MAAFPGPSAFLICAVLIVVAGLFKPLGRAVAAIPAPLANAMLSGVIVGLCFAPVKAIGFNPALGLPIVLAWIAAGTLHWLLPCRRPSLSSSSLPACLSRAFSGLSGG